MKYGRLVIDNELMKTMLGFDWDVTAKFVDSAMRNGRINIVVASDFIKNGVDDFDGDIDKIPVVIPITTVEAHWEKQNDEGNNSL